MIKSIILIRNKQFFRAMNGIGLGRAIFITGLLGIFLFGMFILLHNAKISYYVVGGFICIIFTIQTQRSDKTFLKIIFDNFKLIYLAEYTLLALPLVICLTYYHNWLQTFFLLISLLLIINLEFKKNQNSRNTKIQKLIPQDCFEWKSGVRQTLFAIIILWITGMGTSFFIGSVPVIIFIFGIFPLGFYGKCEPLQMLLAFEKGTNRFLKYKIKTNLFLFTILSFPLILSFLIFHYEYWYIPIIEYFVFIFIHIYFILTKYAYYEPNQITGGHQIYQIIGTVSLFIPFIIPLIWILSIYFYFKSKENLNIYLNDYN